MEPFDVAVLGLGFTGLPTAVAAASAGFRVAGVDTSAHRVQAIASAAPGCGLTTASEDELRPLLARGQLRVQVTAAAARIYVLCVPTPLQPDGEANLAPLLHAVDLVAESLRPGCLVLVQSTCPPGAVDRIVAPRLVQRCGLVPGVDFALAHSPVRTDPGIGAASLRAVPRVVGGVSPACVQTALDFLRQLTDQVVPVSTIRAAELVKVFENTFRLVNISLANELATLCRASDVDVAEVLDAAGTKPYGFLRHRPGPGAGGDCIPVSARFFTAAARHHQVQSPIVEAAIALNDAMPANTVQLVRRLLAAKHLPPLEGRRVLVVGVAYKPDVASTKQSAAVRVLEELRAEAHVSYHDPYVPRLRLSDGTTLRSRPVRPGCADLVLVVTKHRAVDDAVLAAAETMIIDCSTGDPRLYSAVRTQEVSHVR